MKKLSKLLGFVSALSIIAVLALTARPLTTDPPVAVTGVTLDKEAVSIVVGGTGQLTATLAPENAANKAVSWSTSDSAVASVSASGLITANAAGTALITVTTADGGKTDTCTVTVRSPSWSVVGNAGFSADAVALPSLAFDNNGTPYVAYSDHSTSPVGKATVMKFNGAAWEPVGTEGFSADGARDLSLAIYNGTPYVAYKDYSTSPAGATVMKFNGATWEFVGSAGFSAGQADFPSLAIYNGTPYVAYEDTSTTPANKATVMKFNGTAWEVVGERGFSANWARDPSLAIYNGTPYVAYKDYSTPPKGKANVMKFDSASSSWVTVGNADFSADEANDLSLAIYNGTPYVAYEDWGTTPQFKATVMKFE